MVYYPMTTRIWPSIRDSSSSLDPRIHRSFAELCLGDGRPWGRLVLYAVQPSRGAGAAFLSAVTSSAQGRLSLVLVTHLLCDCLTPRSARRRSFGAAATVFGYWVKIPSAMACRARRYPAAPAPIEDKPKQPKSNYAVRGIIF